jgi:hypothetical protein
MKAYLLACVIIHFHLFPYESDTGWACSLFLTERSCEKILL